MEFNSGFKGLNSWAHKSCREWGGWYCRLLCQRQWNSYTSDIETGLQLNTISFSISKLPWQLTILPSELSARKKC